MEDKAKAAMKKLRYELACIGLRMEEATPKHLWVATVELYDRHE